jgi:hypothetical protein
MTSPASNDETDVIAALVTDGRLTDAALRLCALGEGLRQEVAGALCAAAASPDECLTLVDDLIAASGTVQAGDASTRLAADDALKHLAALVATRALVEDWESLVPVIHSLSTNASYRVTEALVRLIAQTASKDFAAGRSFWQESITDDTPELAACVIRGLALSDASASDVLDLFTTVIADLRKEVRHSLGPRAIPDLGRREPQVVYSRLKDWAGRPEELARWNVAKALATPLGGAYIEGAMEILEYLAADERPSVWKAAAEAVAAVAQRRPAYVLPILSRWRSERSRLRCAELALQILSKR